MGRGLSAILPSSTAREEAGLREIPVDLIEPNPRQPRGAFDEEALVALSESIKLRGLLQPLVVRPLPLCKAPGDRLTLAREARLAGWSVRETERRAREAVDGPPKRRPRSRFVVHPDLEDAIAAAEDALSAALGRDVKVRPRGDSFRVEFELDDPREGVDLAERILRRAAA